MLSRCSLWSPQLTALLFFLVILKMGVLTEQVDSVLTPQLRDRYGYDSIAVSVGMVLSILGSLVLVVCIAARQLIDAANLPVIKLVATKAAPDLPLRRNHKWHLFLSQ